MLAYEKLKKNVYSRKWMRSISMERKRHNTKTQRISEKKNHCRLIYGIYPAIKG